MGQGLLRHVTGTPLPPPPAPPSRDANPWVMSASRPSSRLPGLRVPPERIPGQFKEAPPPRPAGTPPAAPSRLRWLPFGILGAIVAAIGIDAARAFQRGDYFGAVIPLVFVAFIAVAIVRSQLRKPG